MDIKNYNELEWDKILTENKYIVVNYESTTDCPVCDELIKNFIALSEQSKYRKITFLRINSKSNPIAEEYIRIKKLPFSATFKAGILLECNWIKTEVQLTQMLERLLKFKLKL